jgi:sporulation protein YlmC with PRC-barrel domain
MLLGLRQLYGKELGPSDGSIGHVRDFYFNDQQWTVRYVVADTGSWLSGRLVLISPHVFENLHQEGDCLLVNVTRQHIEASPAIESHEPVSLQYQAYGDGVETWGVGGFPEAPPPPHLMPSKQLSEDLHLQSTQLLSGYSIQTSNGAIGHVIDFIIDDRTWAICHLVVQTGDWYSRKEVVISPKHIDRISYEESKVFVDVTKEALLDAPRYHVSPLGEAYGDTRNFD